MNEAEEEHFPQILEIGFINFDGRIALGLICDPGVFQLCEPFSLQPFMAVTIPNSLYAFLDKFNFDQNRLTGVNQHQLLLIELDQELKEKTGSSVFSSRADLIDELQVQALQADVKYPKTSMFKRVHTI